jgi:hypothetical protein
MLGGYRRKVGRDWGAWRDGRGIEYVGNLNVEIIIIL